MNKKLSGILRLYAAGAEVLIFILNLDPRKNIPVYIFVALVITCVVLYFLLNSIRDFKNNPIGFKPLYIVLLILEIVLIPGLFMHHQQHYTIINIILRDTNFIVCWYFLIVDFSPQFFKEEKLDKINSNGDTTVN